jgi:hypothetical protein
LCGRANKTRERRGEPWRFRRRHRRVSARSSP